MRARLRTAIRAAWHRSDWEREMAQEFGHHLEERADDLVRRGMTRAAAVRQARLEFGSRERYREEARPSSGLGWLDGIHQDLRYALRAIRRTPAFALVAVISLALGVGANTVVFSVVNALLLKPLPISRPGEVYLVQPNFWAAFSYPNFRDVRDRNSGFAGMAAFAMAQMGVATGQGAERVWGLLVTGNYFELLGVRPALGRFFGPLEDRDPGGAPLAVLAHSTWRTRFAGDSSLVGKTMLVNGGRYTVLGVAPPGFFGTEVAFRPEIFVPMSMEPEIWGSSWLEARDTWNAFVLGRLKDGVTRAQATADLATIATALGREFPAANKGLTIRLTRPGLFGDDVRGPVRAFAGAVLLLAALVLLAACANLASLVAARVVDRAREFALRMAIGAGRPRLVRQLVTETLVLAAGGGAVGWFVARGLLGALTAWHPSEFPLQITVDPDWRVFVVGLCATLAAGLLSALAPARLAGRVDLTRSLKGMPALGPSRRRWTLRELLLATQVALAAALVMACLVSVRGLSRALEMPLGVAADGVGAVSFDLGLVHRSPSEGRLFQRRALDAIARSPTITGAAFGSSVPLSPLQSHVNVYRLETADFSPAAALATTEYDISPGYLAVLGVRSLGGRDFTWHDDDAGPRVAIVNQRFAKLVLAPGDPVGQRFRTGKDAPPIEVVGVVEDGRYEDLTEAPRPVVFWPSSQSYLGLTVLLARSTMPAPFAAEIRRVVTELDPTLPLYDVGPVRGMMSIAFLPARVAAVALTAFGILAVLLAITGIAGMAAYVVSQRTREIGIRMALGAAPAVVLRAILARTVAIVGLGTLAGVALAVAAARVLSSVVAQASPREPAVVVGASIAMVVVGALAVVIPARRAVTVDPLRAVRAD